MPAARTKKPVQPIAPIPPPAPTQQVPAPDGRVVVYDKLEIEERSTASAKGPVTVAWMKKALWWETEKEWQARMVATKGGKPEHYLFGEVGPKKDDGTFQPIHCLNMKGEKVVCWNNAHNRAFDIEWCKALMQTILEGQWAGPFTIPGETVNGETVRISKYGEVLSGQHQGTALILASEVLAKARADGTDHATNPKYPVWVKHAEPFLETIVIRGMSSDPRVLMTVDYNKPRTVADVFYTSELFRDSTPPERKELCKVLAGTTDFLWTRTDAKGYRTHPEMVGFLERHKKLLKCVEYIFNVNKADSGRKLGKLTLQSGLCAALNYLMGCGATAPEDSDAYRNMEPPTEKVLDWSLWDRAEEFWDLLASGEDFGIVRDAFARLVASSPTNPTNKGLGGTGPEKLALLANAWKRWKDHHGHGAPFDEDDRKDGGALTLNYNDLDDKGNKLPDNAIKLIDTADFDGIDCPEVVDKKRHNTAPPEQQVVYTHEQMEDLKEQARLRREREQAGKK